jgi:hypothetical protein
VPLWGGFFFFSTFFLNHAYTSRWMFANMVLSARWKCSINIFREPPWCRVPTFIYNDSSCRKK